MNHEKSIMIDSIHIILSRHCLPDGTINRDDLFSVIAERIGKAAIQNKTGLVKELKARGIIKKEEKENFKIKINLGY